MERSAATVMQRLFSSVRAALGFVLFATLLSACNDVPVAEDLSQSQATEIVAVLTESGIGASAEREQAGKGKYRVAVPSSRYAESVVLLHQRGLPEEPRIGFDELVAPRGLLPNSRELEALRLDRALAADIEEALGNDPDVLAARVIVRSRSHNSPAVTEIPAATVSLRLRSGSSRTEDGVKEIVSRAIPGISRENILVTLYHSDRDGGFFTAEGVQSENGSRLVRVPLTKFLWGWRVPEDEYNSLALAIAVIMAAVFSFGAAVGLGLAWIRSSRLRSDGAGSEGRMPRRGLPGKPESGRRDLPAPRVDEGGRGS